jgi:hypothetical protein
LVRQALFEEYYSPFVTLLIDDSENGRCMSPHKDLAIFIKEVLDQFGLTVADIESFGNCSKRTILVNGTIKTRVFGNYKAIADALRKKVKALLFGRF